MLQSLGKPMIDTKLLAEKAADTSAGPKACRLDGSEVPITIRKLSFDSCAFECVGTFALHEEINIHLHRMGWIRARITSVRPPLAEAAFEKECLV
jgi:hypothetical protein